MAQFSTFIGLDSANGRRPFTYIAVDSQRNLLTVGGGSPADVLAFASGLSSALIAISAPIRPRSLRSLQADEPPLPVLRLGTARQLSLDLQGEHAEPTVKVPAWLSASFDLTDRLHTLGYVSFPHGETPRQWLEAPADSGFQAWLGQEPLDGGTLEGRLQRQLALAKMGLGVPDAMEFFDEITRYKLLRGILPYERVLPLAEINAWMAANTAWLACSRPADVRQSGTADTGIVYFPAHPG